MMTQISEAKFERQQEKQKGKRKLHASRLKIAKYYANQNLLL